MSAFEMMLPEESIEKTTVPEYEKLILVPDGVIDQFPDDIEVASDDAGATLAA
jgi:hypothetical protein